MKKALSLILALVLCLSLCACSKKVELGKPVKRGIQSTTVVDVQLTDKSYVKIDSTSADFLVPIDKDDLDVGDKFIKSTDENTVAIIMTLIVENVGKRDLTIGPNSYIINYDNGNKYRADTGYIQTADGWSELTNYTLEKVTSGAVTIKVIAWVPDVIIDSTKPLSLDFFGASYKIR